MGRSDLEARVAQLEREKIDLQMEKVQYQMSIKNLEKARQDSEDEVQLIRAQVVTKTTDFRVF